MQRRLTSMVLVGVLGLSAGACGDDSLDDPGGLGRQIEQQTGQDSAQPAGQDDDNQSSDDDDFAAAFPGGGGGTLIFDGEEIPIANVTCVFGDEDTFSVGTISDNQFRVFVDQNNPLNDVSAQILDGDFLQWFPQNVQGDEAEHDGETFTSGPKPYFNNSDDRVVEASFTIDCP